MRTGHSGDMYGPALQMYSRTHNYAALPIVGSSPTDSKRNERDVVNGMIWTSAGIVLALIFTLVCIFSLRGEAAPSPPSLPPSSPLG